MDDTYIQFAASISAVIFLVISMLQTLLALGFPLGEYSWGGFHKGVLPVKLRIASMISAIILLIIGFVFLIHSKIILIEITSLNLIVWIFTVFLGLNTIGNLVSKSKKEKLIMAPLSCIAFISCLFVAIFS
ncbi:hypothetical protein ABES25_04980 [Bacillus gobiensis]|uniref:hypothetical protein n=1 Tax=Bacillus gobiensis TaxID=1441095 RepID=UPI003D19CBB5